MRQTALAVPTDIVPINISGRRFTQAVGSIPPELKDYLFLNEPPPLADPHPDKAVPARPPARDRASRRSRKSEWRGTCREAYVAAAVETSTVISFSRRWIQLLRRAIYQRKERQIDRLLLPD
ncbi:uncharacterized protein LOC144189624 [Stigmatopora nigra]